MPTGTFDDEIKSVLLGYQDPPEVKPGTPAEQGVNRIKDGLLQEWMLGRDNPETRPMTREDIDAIKAERYPKTTQKHDRLTSMKSILAGAQ